MLEFLFANQNMPFTVALIVMLIIGLLEGVTTVLGFGASSMLDSLLPDADVDIELDIDGAADGATTLEPTDGFDVGEIGHPAALSRVLGWLHVGRVPILILLIVFLFAFGFGGLVVQQLAHSLTGHLMPALLATVPALVIGIATVRVAGHGLARLIPKDETSAVSERTFIGRVATITLGTARPDSPAQAKLRDQHGQTHYVMVEPDSRDESFDTGTDVLLVSRQGAVFRAIRNTNASLTDPGDQTIAT